MSGRIARVLHASGRNALVSSVVARANRVAARFGPWQVRVEGEALLVNSFDRWAALLVQKWGSNESFEMALWRQACRPGGTIVDVGANLGLFSFVAARAVGPEGRVFAFEADPSNAALLQRGAKLNGYDNLHIIAKAVSDRAGEIEFWVRDDHKGDGQLAASAGAGRRRIVVPAVTLDAELAGESIHAMKIDVQGAETLVIRGLGELVERSPAIRVFSEFWPGGLARCGGSAVEYLTWWRERGFSVGLIDEEEGRVRDRMSDDELVAAAERRGYANLLLHRDGLA